MARENPTSGKRRPLPHARLGHATRRAAESLSRPVRSPPVPVWTARMTCFAVIAVIAAAAAAFIDAAAIRFVMAERSSPLLRWMAHITDLGKSHWYLAPAGLSFIFVGLADWSSRARRDRARLSFIFGQAAFAFAAVAISGILVNLCKLLVGRARPRLIDDGGAFQFDPFGFDYLFHSFPSGHATTVGAVALVLILWMPRLWPLVLAAGLVLASTRIAALAHYPSDVIAGFALGLLSSLCLARWLGARGAAFRLEPGRLLPLLRHGRAWMRPRAPRRADSSD